MAGYADYSYYEKEYGGKNVDSTTFGRFIKRASFYIDRITGGRVPNSPPESVKMAACAVVDAMFINEQGGELASQSVGSWSKSYASKKAKSNEQRIYDAAMQFLSGSGLIKRWL